MPLIQILKTIPWDRVNFKIVAIEIDHVPEGKTAIREFMEEKGYIFFKELHVDFFFYNPKFQHEFNVQYISADSSDYTRW